MENKTSSQNIFDIKTYSVFIFLVVVWGFAYFFMKRALVSYTATETALLRIAFAAIAVLPLIIQYCKKLNLKDFMSITVSGLLGNGLPALLYMFAMKKVDSNIGGILNATTPIWVIIIGYLYYKNKISKYKTIGILLGFVGIAVLFLSKGIQLNYNLINSLFILMATLCYGLNINIVSNKLSHLESRVIGIVSLLPIGIISIILLLIGIDGTPLLQLPFNTEATIHIAILGIVGTAFTNVLFYYLVKRSNVHFATMVTYFMPFVSILVGYFIGETIYWQSIICLALIIVGVYLVKNY